MVETLTDDPTDSREMPTWAQIRERLVQMGRDEGLWAGIPLPVEGLRMHIEDKYPYKKLEERFGDKDTVTAPGFYVPDVPDDADEWFLSSAWYSTVKRGTVYVFRGPTGKVRHSFHSVSEYERLINTMLVAVSAAWDVNAEIRAMLKLKELVGPNVFDVYFLTGTFIESSKRSGIVYVFRKSAPTLAVRCGPNGGLTNGKILAALCLHPVAYYDQSWAGAQVPTDDVVSHLVLMRGDEHLFWRRCNQHSPGAREARIV